MEEKKEKKNNTPCVRGFTMEEGTLASFGLDPVTNIDDIQVRTLDNEEDEKRKSKKVNK